MTDILMSVIVFYSGGTVREHKKEFRIVEKGMGK